MILKFKKIKNNQLAILFIIAFSICDIYKIGRLANGTYQRELVLLTIAMLTIIVVVKYSSHNKICTASYKYNYIKWIAILFLSFQIIYELYALFLVAIHKTEISLISTNIISIMPPIMALVLLYLFEENAVLVLTYSIILNFIFCFFGNILTYGPNIILLTIQSAIAGDAVNPIARTFEVHDSSFASGLLFIYVIINKNINNRKYILMNLLVIIIFGQKRIEFASIIFVLLILMINYLGKIDKVPRIIRYHLLEILMIASIGICVFYVLISMNGTLDAFMQAVGIKTNNRGTFYSTISKYAYFSPKYLGIGRNAAYSILSRYNYMTGNLHNDLLKLYVENGFWLFFSWLIAMLYFLPHEIKIKYGTDAAMQSMALLIYLFILYCTDNTDSYFCTQLAILLCISAVCLNARAKETKYHDIYSCS